MNEPDGPPNLLDESAGWRELRSMLVPFIARRVAAQDVDDVLQEVFVRMQRGLSSLRESDKLNAWVYQIARNTVIDHLRRPAACRERAARDDWGNARPEPLDVESGAHELSAVIGHFVRKLPEIYRTALELTELEGVTQAEAARRLGLSIPGMKSRVQRGRAELRALLDACCDIELDARGAVIACEPRNRPPELPNCCSKPRAT